MRRLCIREDHAGRSLQNRVHGGWDSAGCLLFNQSSQFSQQQTIQLLLAASVHVVSLLWLIARFAAQLDRRHLIPATKLPKLGTRMSRHACAW